MTKNSKLDLFIQESIKHGKSFEEIKRVLLEAGWQKHQIRSGLETYYLTKYPIAVPKPKPFISPRLFFLYLLYFLMLYLVVYNTVSLLFICLNYYLPDGLGEYQKYSNHIRENIQINLSVILVCLPMVFFISYLTNKIIKSTKQSIPRIRLILIYITLFISACIITGNACLFVYYFLKGELSIRFILKILILMAIIAGFYFYYRAELKRDEQNT